MILLIIQIYFSRHYYADADKTRIEIERLIKEGEWDNKEFIKMQEKLLEQLQIKRNTIDNKVMEKLSALEKNIENTWCSHVRIIRQITHFDQSSLSPNVI